MERGAEGSSGAHVDEHVFLCAGHVVEVATENGRELRVVCVAQ